MVGDLVLLPLLCASIAEKVAETWKLSLRVIFSSSFSPRGVQMASGPVGAYHDGGSTILVVLGWSGFTEM